MRAVDSGVAIAGFATWHESHEKAREVLQGRPAIAARAMTETMSVLTRLPAPHRAPTRLVASFLRQNFTEDPLTLEGAHIARFLTERVPSLGLSGGALYDATIAETARAAGATLVTLDRRALPTYERVGCAVLLLDA
ncbi:MAG: PIN domain-containing protein [Aeromicrobium sp.]|uniref:PIN domain-containing protein n=1 Tax=Aeromicrobium sp. TaxID=1871063 RepID=UPI0039E3E4E8